MTERRFSEDEVALIFERATEAQQAARKQLSSGEGMTLAELEQIGREVGIAPELVAQAARSLDRVGVPTGRRFLGLPLGVARTVELGRKLSEDEWERVVVLLRETFDARGAVKHEGGLRQWTNGNLQALLEPGEKGHRLRMRTMHGASLGWMTAGLGVLGVGFVAFAAAALGGGLADAGALGAAAVAGAGLFAAGALRLPGWARERRRQMEEIARRLTTDANAD